MLYCHVIYMFHFIYFMYKVIIMYCVLISCERLALLWQSQHWRDHGDGQYSHSFPIPLHTQSTRSKLPLTLKMVVVCCLESDVLNLVALCSSSTCFEHFATLILNGKKKKKSYLAYFTRQNCLREPLLWICSPILWLWEF